MKDVEVDVIVVGAGTSGAVLAARLSEDPDRRVLLVDEGPDFTDDDRPARVSDASTVPSPVSDSGWTAWSETALDETRSLPVVRGRLVGGSSAVNGSYFIRGTPDDFDGWAALGNDEWSWERVLPCFRRSESDADFGGDDRVHGHAGPVPVSRAVASDLLPVTAAFVEAAAVLGFPAEPDKNAPGVPGVGMVPCSAVEGFRTNTATAYLDPVRHRSNLVVRGGMRVRRVVVEHGRVTGVEVDAGRTGRVLRAPQVVLSAGAVGSARLLMLSGVGPAEDLLRAGLDVVVDAPALGRLWDHPGIDVHWRPLESAGQAVHPPGPGFQAALHLSTGVGARDDGDVEILAVTRPYGRATGDAPGDPLLSLRIGLQQPRSPGRVMIDSASPHAPAIVEHRHLTDPADRAVARAAVRLAVELLESSPMSSIVAERQGPTSDELDDDGALDRWIDAHLGTAMHASGTCPMGSADDPNAVVDQHCRVRGVEGLRVVDTSIMPAITSRGPAATAVMIGERAAELFR
jgi:choline dehydrogenase